jgi:hypothetical protein
LTFGDAVSAVVVVVAVVAVVPVVVVPVVVVCEQLAPAGLGKSPWRMCAGTALLETMIGTNGCFFEPVR